MPFSTISSWVLLLARTLESYDLDSAALFREVGLDPERTRQPGARFAVRKLTKLWRLAQERTEDPAFGLELGRQWHPTSMHALGYSWMASDSLRDAIQRAARYGKFISDAAQLALERGEENSWFTIEPLNCSIADSGLDAALAVMLRMCQDLVGRRLAPLRVTMLRPEPADTSPFLEYFQAPVEFGTRRHGLLFANRVFDEPLASANPDLTRVNDQVIVDYLARFDRTHFAHKARSTLTHRLASGQAGQDTVARLLNVSTRTLQRKLAAEGTTFKRILDDARRELAIAYMRDDHYSVGDIAYMLGYSDSGNFTKAFRRWYQCTPKAWRAARWHASQAS